MERPISIVWFERCYLGSLVVGLVNTALSWNTAVEKMAANPSAEQFGPNFGSNLLIFGTLLGIVISLLLWYFAARKASSVAKWIITVLFVISILGLGFSLISGTFPQGIGGVLGIVAWVLNVIAVWQLFRPDAELWFGEKPGRGTGGVE